MSGGGDTSTSQQRALFSQLVEGGTPMTGLAAAANAVANSPALVPDTTAALLDMGPSTTYAQAAARVLFRIQAGQSFL